jgi:GT2 family glycosyltransferase
MVNYYQNHVKCGLIGPQFLNQDSSIQSSVFPPQTIFNAFREYFFKLDSFSKYYPISKNPTSVWAISGGAVLVKSELFTKIKGWDERYFMYFEDLDLCRKIRNLNLHIFYYPNCRVIHCHGASGSKLANHNTQWRRLIPSSITYHGYVYHKILNLVIWSGQKWQNTLNGFNKIKQQLILWISNTF